MIDRGRAAASFGWLAGLAVIFHRVLVADWGDNAYLYLALTGTGLGVAAVPFGVVALLPHGRIRSALALAARGLLWTVGGLGTVLLAIALMIIPFQGYGSPATLVSHLAGLALLLPALFFTGYRFFKQREQGGT